MLAAAPLLAAAPAGLLAWVANMTLPGPHTPGARKPHAHSQSPALLAASQPGLRLLPLEALLSDSKSAQFTGKAQLSQQMAKGRAALLLWACRQKLAALAEVDFYRIC